MSVRVFSSFSLREFVLTDEMSDTRDERGCFHEHPLPSSVDAIIDRPMFIITEMSRIEIVEREQSVIDCSAYECGRHE